MGSSTVTEIIDFSGGMNTLLAPHLIGKNEARALVNVDVRFGALQSMPNLDMIQPLDLGAYFYQYNREVYSYPSFRTNVLWDYKWYWSDGINTGKMLPDGTILPLGLPTPTVALTQTLVGAVDEGTHEGDFKYTYTFWSSETGAESAPAPLPLYITAEGQDISLTGFEPLPAEATHYRLYRIGGYLPIFLLVDKFTTTTYLDDLDDTKIDGRTLQTLRNGPPPVNLTNLCELNGRFYGSVGNDIYFSALGNPDSWYVSDFIPVRGHVIGLATVPAGLLILGQFSTSLLYGTDPVNFRLKVVSDQYGCLGKQSISYLGDSAIWLSNKQIVMSNGYKIMDVTAFKTDRILNVVPTGAVVENETYYLSYKPGLYPSLLLVPKDDLYPDSVEGTGLVDQGIISLDFKRGNTFSYKMIYYDEIRTIGMVNSDVHVSTGGYNSVDIPCEEAMFEDCLSFLNCTPFELSVMNVYQSQGLARLHYLSPKFMDSGLSTLKQYDKVRIRYVGAFEVTILFDNVRTVVTRNIISKEGEDSLAIIGIPNRDNLSHSIQFLLVGVGVISSIQYSWKNREVVN